MREAISAAEVGDDVFGEDPTVLALERRMAEMTGMGSAVLMPTGTMSNGVAVRSMTTPGDEVLCGSASHLYGHEGGQHSALGGVQLHRLDEAEDGCLPPPAVSDALSRPEDVHHAPRTLVALESTHNMLGGIVPAPASVAGVLAAAEEAGASVFLDGARLWHSAEASGRELSDLCAGFRMVTVCFSKALGCPACSVLACGPGDESAVRLHRKWAGGGMRQSGVLAAACLYALERNLPRLGVTHGYAAELAEAIERSPGLDAFRRPETNIVLARVRGGDAGRAERRLAELGVLTLAVSPDTLRMVTHLSLAPEDVGRAADVLATFGG